MSGDAPFERDLRILLGAENVVVEPASFDFAGRALGTPRAVVRPGSASDVASVVQICRRHRIPLVPVGRRTAYWGPLHFEGCLVVESARLAGVELSGDVTVVGAGEPVRPLDVLLRARGRYLPIHPDSYGDTPVGSMVSSACTSGIGMGLGGIGNALGGIEVVTGRGDVIWTGAAQRAGVAPFLREGLPDLTGLFLGSEGGLGVITRVALLARTAPFRVRLSGTVSRERLRNVLDLGRLLAGVYDTFRVVRSLADRNDAYAVDLWVLSPWSASEAAARAEEVKKKLSECSVTVMQAEPETEDARRGASPDYDRRWQGPMPDHQKFAARSRLHGIDVNAPYEVLEPVLFAAEEAFADFAAHGVAEVRIALYLAPELVNVGVHATVPLSFTGWSHADSQRHLARLSELPIVPYRLGRSWPLSFLDGLGATRDHLRALKRELDPDGILQPALPLFS